MIFATTCISNEYFNFLTTIHAAVSLHCIFHIYTTVQVQVRFVCFCLLICMLVCLYAFWFVCFCLLKLRLTIKKNQIKRILTKISIWGWYLVIFHDMLPSLLKYTHSQLETGDPPAQVLKPIGTQGYLAWLKMYSLLDQYREFNIDSYFSILKYTHSRLFPTRHFQEMVKSSRPENSRLIAILSRSRPDLLRYWSPVSRLNSTCLNSTQLDST